MGEGGKGTEGEMFSESRLCNGFFVRILVKFLQQGGYKMVCPGSTEAAG